MVYFISTSLEKAGEDNASMVVVAGEGSTAGSKVEIAGGSGSTVGSKAKVAGSTFWPSKMGWGYIGSFPEYLSNDEVKLAVVTYIVSQGHGFPKVCFNQH